MSSLTAFGSTPWPSIDRSAGFRPFSRASRIWPSGTIPCTTCRRTFRWLNAIESMFRKVEDQEAFQRSHSTVDGRREVVEGGIEQVKSKTGYGRRFGSPYRRVEPVDRQRPTEQRAQGRCRPGRRVAFCADHWPA